MHEIHINSFVTRLFVVYLCSGVSLFHHPSFSVHLFLDAVCARVFVLHVADIRKFEWEIPVNRICSIWLCEF